MSSCTQVKIKTEDEESCKFGEVFIKLNEKSMIFVCTRCNEAFKEMDIFIKHLYDELESSRPMEINLQEEEQASLLEPMYLCEANLTGKELELVGGEEQSSMKTENCKQAVSRKLHKVRRNSTIDAYVPHEKPRNKAKPVYKCDVCDKQLSSKASLRNHSLRHIKQKAFPCNLCTEQYTTEQKLETHKRLHNGEKPYTCDFCPSTFTTASLRKRHMSIHTGELPHVCEECGKGFVTGYKLKEHVRITHLMQRDFKCETCGKEFSKKKKLRIHIYAVHSDAPRDKICDVCNADFKTTKSLSQHKKIHGEKMYLCKTCGKAFAQSGRLSTHMKTHDVVKQKK